MKNAFAIFTVFALFTSMAFADVYKNSYVVDDWLEVTRMVQTANLSPCTINGVTGVCGATGAVQTGKVANSVQTTVYLYFKNIGTADREDISVSESLIAVPNGAQAVFSAVPYYADGRSVTWGMGLLAAGQEKSVSYSFLASISQDDTAKFLQPTVAVRPLEVALSAPETSKVGGWLTLTLKSTSGQPVSGATIQIISPDGTYQSVKTGNGGTANFISSKEGFYTYGVEGYRLLRVPSTNAVASLAGNETGEAPLATSSATDAGLGQTLMGMVPIVAAMFVMAVILLLAYNFFSSRDEDAEELAEEKAGEEASQAGTPVYTQKFSFAEETRKDQRVQEMTRDIIGSRKRQMQSPVEQEQEKAEKEIEQEIAESEKTEMASDGEPAHAYTTESQPSEKTDAYESREEADEELAEEAGEEGESSKSDDDSIEATIARLEEIRARLRAARGATEDAPAESGGEEAGESAGDSEGEEEGAETEEEAAEPAMEGEAASADEPVGDETVISGEELEPETAPASAAKKPAKRRLPRHKPRVRAKPKPRASEKKMAKARKR